MERKILVTIVASTFILLYAISVKQQHYITKYKQLNSLLEMSLSYAKEGPQSILAYLRNDAKETAKLQIFDKSSYCGIYQGLLYGFKFGKLRTLETYFKVLNEDASDKASTHSFPQVIGSYQIMNDRISWQFQFLGKTHYFYAPKVSQESNDFPPVLFSSKGIFSNVICDQLAFP